LKYFGDEGYHDINKKYNQGFPINTNLYGGRIDFILAHDECKNIIDKIKAYTFYTQYSDHIPIIIDISFKAY